MDDLVTRAREAAGDDDRRPLRFLPALRRLLDAVESEADLNPFGRQALHDFVVAQLVTQIETSRLVQANPEIERIPVENVVVITGMPRTGTTALHNLLAEHPDLRAPRLWEMLAPAASTDPASEERLIRTASRYVEQYYSVAPAFRDLHPLDALRPDECHRLTATTFSSSIFAQRYHVPSYLAWLDEQDLRETYEYHRTLLRCMLWRRPGQHVVLKCPSHLWHLEALAAVYPQARIVRLHRDPATNLASACNLTAVVRGANGARADRHAIGSQWFTYARQGLSGLRQGDRYGPAAHTLDVRQRDLRADPLRVAARVCEFAGVALSREAGARLARHLSEQAPERSGGPGYSLADFGLDQSRIDRQFGGYRAEFNV
ncbi:sulfotransferase family protein [Micromonospora pattaloongensis]|uniref:sulfotransferase family protein n=1 Tax=Micromonospora pattaloongensis TaxID=405436 RepID=UPI001FE1AAC7|nr:sulfotransferase [Micromonospora pattaloongensis]